MSAHRGKKIEGLNLEPVATAQKRSLRSQTSGQLSEPTIEGNPGDNIEEQVKLTAEGLPEGWIKEVKTQRTGSTRKNTFYVDPKSGYAFHSLEDALRYVQTGSILSCVAIPQKRSREEVLILMNSSETKSTPRQTVKTQTATSSPQVTYQAKLGSDGLPVDWIKEVKARTKDSSRKDMFYIDPKTGYAFFSLKDALRYVETGDQRYCKARPQKRSMEEIKILSSQTNKTESTASPAQPSNLINDGTSGDNVCKAVQENELTSHGLPKNWIKELKPRKNGTKADPFYIEPDTGYAFLSLKDALRYVATGNVLSCVMRPQKRSIEEVQALISSSEMSSISGMKAVQRESSQPVPLNTSQRKRKRSPVKSSALKPEEDLNIKGTDNATGTTSRQVKQRIGGAPSVRASPRLLSLKAENHEENNESCSTLPGMSNSSAPPDPKTEEVAMVENGSSTRAPLRNGKLRKDTLMPHRVSPRLAAPETTNITSVETKNSLTSKNRRLKSQLNLENKEETIEGASGGSTGKLLRSGKMRTERPTPPLRGSSHLAALTATTDDPNEPDLDLKEETIEGIKGNSTKETTRRQGKMHREKRASVRASPRLAAHTDATSVENDNSMMSQHDLELKETTIEGANSGSTETQPPIRRGKMRRERGTPVRASSRLATQNMTNDATTVQNENSAMSNDLFGPTSQPDLEGKEETVERENISSTGPPLRRGKMRRERSTALGGSSQLATQNMTNDATTVQNENSTMSNALFGPTSQPDLEHEETVEGTKGSSTKGTTRRRGKMYRERGTPVRASSRLATPTMTNDATFVKNENSTTMSNALFGPTSQPDLERKEETVERANVSSTGTPSLRRGKMRRERPTPLREEALFGPTSQAGLKRKEETVEGANISSTETPMRRGKMRRERPTPLRASSRLATVDATNNATSVENENTTMSNDLFGPTSQPDLECKEETVQGANVSSTETRMRRGKMCRERPTPLRTSTRLAAPDTPNNATPVEIDNTAAINALFEPSSPSLSFLNVGPTGQPDLELQEERIEEENDSSPGTPLYNTRPFKASSFQAALKVTTDCTSEKNKDNIGSNFFSVPHHLHPDLNLESSLADLQLEEVITGANGNKSESTMGPAADENHEENNKTSNTMSELPFSPARPDLNLGPTNQPYWEPKVETIAAANSSAIRTATSQRVEPRREVPTPVKTSPCLEALKATTEVASSNSNDKNRMTSNQPYWEPKVETIAAANSSAIRTTTSQRVEPRREVPTPVKASPCLEALKATTEAASSNTNEKNRMTSSALPQLSHFPGRPDLNLGPTSELTVKRQEEMSRAYGSSTGRPTTPVNAMRLHGVRPTPPVNAMTETASYYNYGNNIKISNYFGSPVRSPVSQIITGSTSQPNPREIWFDTTAAAAVPSTPISEVKRAPDLNMVPMSWPEHNMGPKLEQQQHPAAVNTMSEFNMQPPIPSEILYQDPTMDALLSAQEAGPSMPPHMSIDALNSPLSPFFGDFWHDPCLSYAFNTLTGGMDQQRTTGLGAGPENNINWAGARNGGPPVENPHIGPNQPTTQTPQYMNNGMQFPK